MTTTRHAQWLESGADTIFFWHNLPADINNRNTAVIIIGPIGPEYMHCFRSIKYLCDELALAGYHSIRYDPIGMGNSSGDLLDDNIWHQWITTPQKLSDYVKESYGITNIILVGLRSGCLVLSEVQKNMPLHSAVFWYPYTHGSAYIRDIQLLDSMLYQDNNLTNNTTLNGGGYPLSDTLQNDIKNINLLSEKYSPFNHALIINSDESKRALKLHKQMETTVKHVSSVCLTGLDAMTKQVAISKIPVSNIQCIVDWLKETTPLQTGTLEKPEIIHSQNYPDSCFKETIIQLHEKRNIFAIITTPPKNDLGKIVIIANTGAAHHVGPNRFHVSMARKLACIGISTLRIDLSNLGDSSNDYEQDSHHPYPANAAEDIHQCIDYVTSSLGYQEVILCGLCSGAHNIFHAALEFKKDAISKLVIINPLTFYWKPGQSIFGPEENQTEIDEAYYQKQLFNYKKWLNLLTNPVKIYNIATFSSAYLLKKIKRLFSTNKNSQLAKDLIFLAENKIAVILIYSKGDPGHKILISQASAVLKSHEKKGLYTSIQIDNADHTFSSISSRHELLETVTKTITQGRQHVEQ